MPSSVSSLINLSNSIIGVSILTMPYCFQQCGILLSCVVLACSAFINKYACHMLLKSSLLTRRRKFEYLAYHTLGYNGKLLIELGLICFLLGGCVALFVVAGDLLPPLLGSGISQENRIYLLVFLGFFVALPLSLRRNTESLTSFSLISMIFYTFLAIKMLLDSLPSLLSGNWIDKVVWWNTDNLLAILPIFAMALAGQPQVFEVFDLAGTDVQHLKLCDRTVASAMHICLTVYTIVGFCGYVSSYEKVATLPGNSLLLLDDTWMSWMFKFGFVASLIMSFPLCLFPCRTSLHSLIYRRGVKLHEVSTSLHDFIPENRFKLLTLALLSSTLGAALVIPRIELFLGLTGATIGCIVCLVVPAIIYIGATKKDQTFERLSAQFVILLGLVIMALCTASMINRLNQPEALKPPDPIAPLNLSDKVLDRPVLEESKHEVINEPKLPPANMNLGEKRAEPVEPHEEIHEIKTLSNKTSDVKYQIGTNERSKMKGPPKLRPTKSNSAPVVAAEVRSPGQISSNLKPKTPNQVSPVQTGVQKNDKDEIKLLEQIAEVQQEQKKMIEDIQKELKQEIALHKEVKSNQTKDEERVNKFQQKILILDNKIKDQGVVVKAASDRVSDSVKPVEFKGPMKVIKNTRDADKVNQDVVESKDIKKEAANLAPSGVVPPAVKPDSIASLDNAIEHIRKANESLPQHKVATPEKAELLSELAKDERPALLKDIDNSLKNEKALIEQDKLVTDKKGPSTVKTDNKKKPPAVPLVVKMHPANASKAEKVHKEI